LFATQLKLSVYRVAKTSSEVKRRTAFLFLHDASLFSGAQI